MKWSVQGLKDRGFHGFIRFDELPHSNVPSEPGVYVVLRDSAEPVRFREESPAGAFKGREPSVSLQRLGAKWIDDAVVVYIGKAGTAKSAHGLRRRLDQYRRHGLGENVGHWGGRYIWQLDDAADLRIAWRCCEEGTDAAAVESGLLREFAEDHSGRLPFANLKRGRHPCLISPSGTDRS